MNERARNDAAEPLPDPPPRRSFHRIHWALAALVGFALWHLGQAGWIHAKARLAQYLLQAAWERRLAGEHAPRPWPWADTWPVARLVAPRQGVKVFVLAGASGRTLAFGPGHLFGTAPPGASGNSVISAHRDTHFAFLRHLAPGDVLEVETPDGMRRRYVVEGSEVVDRRDLRALAPEPTPRLTLITCFPFDSVNARGPLRYVVRAAGA
jgi:sortase A